MSDIPLTHRRNRIEVLAGIANDPDQRSGDRIRAVKAIADEAAADVEGLIESLTEQIDLFERQLAGDVVALHRPTEEGKDAPRTPPPTRKTALRRAFSAKNSGILDQLYIVWRETPHSRAIVFEPWPANSNLAHTPAHSICFSVSFIGPPVQRPNQVTYDVGNFLMANEDPIEALNKVFPNVVHVHFKDWEILPSESDGAWPGIDGRLYRGKALGKGIVDLPAAVARLKELNYDGYISPEYEGIGDPEEDAIEAIKQLHNFEIRNGVHPQSAVDLAPNWRNGSERREAYSRAENFDGPCLRHVQRYKTDCHYQGLPVRSQAPR